MELFSNSWQSVHYTYHTALPDFPPASAPAAQVAYALRGMRFAIEKHGWIQGVIGSPAHGFCMQGAFLYRNAMNGDTRSDLSYSNGLGMATAAALVKAIARSGHADPFATGDWDTVITFNDIPGRAKEQVLAVIESALAATLAEISPPAAPEQPPVLVPDFIPGEFLGELTGVGA